MPTSYVWRGNTGQSLPTLQISIVEITARCLRSAEHQLCADCIRRNRVAASLFMQTSFRSKLVLSSLLAISLPFIASAQTPQEPIRASSTPKLNNGATIDEITQSPLPGLFDVRVGGDVLYVDETGTFILQGNLINLQTGKNLTH